MDTICQMLSETRKKNGEEYPGSTLSDIIVMLHIYKKKNKVDVNLLSDTFRHVWTVLDTIMKSRNAQGVGIPNPKDAITVAEENILWEKGILGFEDPNTLCNTVLFMVGLHFGLHGGQEHRNLRRYPKCQIEREYKDKKDCMVYHEEHLKNKQSGIWSKFYQKPRVVYSFCSGNEPRCFVHILDRYLDLCPPPSPFCSGFYLRSKPNWLKEENFNDSYWYMRFPVGKNMLSQTISTMMEKAGIVGNFSNNSLRATTASRLYANNVDEQLITEQTGH